MADSNRYPADAEISALFRELQRGCDRSLAGPMAWYWRRRAKELHQALVAVVLAAGGKVEVPDSVIVAAPWDAELVTYRDPLGGWSVSVREVPSDA